MTQKVVKRMKGAMASSQPQNPFLQTFEKIKKKKTHPNTSNTEGKSMRKLV